MTAAAFKTQHENFDPEIKSSKLKVIRQDRKPVEHLKAYLQIENVQYPLFNISGFGVAAWATVPCEWSQPLTKCQLIVEGYEVATPHLQFVRSEPKEGRHLLAFEVTGEPIAMGRIDAIEKVMEILSAEQKNYLEYQVVPAEFARRVYEVKNLLESLQNQINQFEKGFVQTDTKTVGEFEDTVIKMVADHLNQIMPAKNKELSVYVQGLNPEQLKTCFEFFRSKLYHLIYQAPFADRTFHKPLGYAGDYEMMNIIYKGDRLGHSLFARCLSYYWVGQPAAQAVRNRASYLIRRISETCERLKESPKPIRILSLACGPVMEWQRFLAEVQKYNFLNIEVDLIDQDENALKHAQQRLKDLSHTYKNKIQFHFYNRSIKNIIQKGLDQTDYDLIYTAGLFDYFTDPVAQYGGTRLFEALRPQGELVIGNFNVDNPNEMMMVMALDWNLIYRSDSDMHRLFGHLTKEMRIDKEDLNINLFCRLWKK